MDAPQKSIGLKIDDSIKGRPTRVRPFFITCAIWSFNTALQLHKSKRKTGKTRYNVVKL